MVHSVAKCIAFLFPYFIPEPVLNDRIPRRRNKTLDLP
jgi:hypothetical protein